MLRQSRDWIRIVMNSFSSRQRSSGRSSRHLHRPPDPSGLDTFTNLLQRGVPHEMAIASILSSDEYFGQI